MADLKEWKSRVVNQGSSGEQVHSILVDWQSAEDNMEQKFTDIQQAHSHKITPTTQYCDNRFCVNWDRDVCTLDHCHFTAA